MQCTFMEVGEKRCLNDSLEDLGFVSCQDHILKDSLIHRIRELNHKVEQWKNKTEDCVKIIKDIQWDSMITVTSCLHCREANQVCPICNSLEREGHNAMCSIGDLLEELG